MGYMHKGINYQTYWSVVVIFISVVLTQQLLLSLSFMSCLLLWIGISAFIASVTYTLMKHKRQYLFLYVITDFQRQNSHYCKYRMCIMSVQAVFMSLFCGSLYNVCTSVLAGRQDSVFIAIVKDSRRTKQDRASCFSYTVFSPPLLENTLPFEY